MVAFSFEFIARNIGIATLENSLITPLPIINSSNLFIGVQVHDKDFNSINSSHIAVWHSGSISYYDER